MSGKPVQNLRIGASYYNDVLSKGATTHDNRVINWKVNQNLFTGSLAFFGKKFEFLGESTLANDRTDTTGSRQTLASYIYTGYKVTEKIIPYIRFDDIGIPKQTQHMIFITVPAPRSQCFTARARRAA